MQPNVVFTNTVSNFKAIQMNYVI